jgi:hypothetical protein
MCYNNFMDKQKEQKVIENTVASNINAISASALSAALGRLVVLEAVTVITPQGKEKVVYKAIQSEDDIAKAVTFLNERNAMTPTKSQSFYIIQQEAPDLRALDLLLNRHLGKVADNVNLNQTLTIGQVASAAVERRNKLALAARTVEASKYDGLGIPSSFLPI